MRDVVVVGGGHNGLVCAAYLALEGLDVEVVEANDEVGGCVWTEDLPSGHRLERGAIDLSMVDDIVADLSLRDHGLRLLGRETLVGARFGDDTRLLFQSDLEATLAGLSSVDRRDRDAYRDFAGLAGSALAAFDALPGVPSFADIVGVTEALASSIDLTRLLVSSTESVLDRRFENPHLKSAIAMYGAHAQLPPWLPGTGLFSMLLPGSHGGAAYRVEGGTRAFVSALVSVLDAAGATVRTGSSVASISKSGAHISITTSNGEVITARKVISSLDIRRTVPLIAEPSEAMHRAAVGVRSGALNVGELKIDLALSAPAGIAGSVADSAIWLLQERTNSLHTSFGEIIAGTLPTSTALMWAAPSALDSTAAPEGGGTVWISAFVPAQLRGRAWDLAAEEEAAERVLDGFARITGEDLRHATVDRRITGPAGWSRRTGAIGGNPNHIDLTLDQLFGWRPPGLKGYRTDNDWLYLTGAGTYPGGGVSGIPGRNAARAVLEDLGGKERSRKALGAEARGVWKAWGLYRSMRRSA